MDVDQLYENFMKWLAARGPSILLAIGVLIVGLWFIKFLYRLLEKRMAKREINPSLKPFLLSLSVTILRVLLLLAVMQIAGIQMTLFAAIIASMGVAAGLALSGTLQNFASGILILFLKPFQVGDNILAQNHEGTVTAIRIFYTVVTTFDNRTVVIPNSKLSNEVIVNLSGMGTRRMDIELKFNNSIDYKEVRKLIEEAIAEADNILDEPKWRIGIASLEADGYKVVVNIWIDAHGFVDAKMQFQEHLMYKLKGSGLKLPGLS